MTFIISQFHYVLAKKLLAYFHKHFIIETWFHKHKKSHINSQKRSITEIKYFKKNTLDTLSNMTWKLFRSESLQYMVLLIRIGHEILPWIKICCLIFLITIAHLSPDDRSLVVVTLHLMTDLLVPFLPLLLWVKALVESVVLLRREHYFF